MAFGDDLRGELYNKLGVDSDNNPLQLIDQGDKERAAGNHSKGKKLYESAIQISQQQAEKFITQNQHRAAAEALYVQALAHDRLDRETDRNNLFTKVTDELLEAANTAIAFEEDKRGVTTATIAGLVCLMHGNQERAFSIYSEYMNKIGERPNAEFLKKLLYSLGYLLDALKNNNIGALTDAQNYISTDLKPMMSGASLNSFQKLLDNVVEYVQKELQSQITMPKITISNEFPRDIQYNQVFDLVLEFNNEGDGKATNLEININIPEDIEILHGTEKEAIEQFDPTQSIVRNFSLRFQTGDSTGEQAREISGSVSYEDMLGNSHKQYFGPLSLEFTAISKKEEYIDRLNDIFSSIKEADQLFGSIPNIIADQYKEHLSLLKDSINSAIEEEDFEQVEFGLKLANQSIDWLNKYRDESEYSIALSNEIDNLIQKNVENEKQAIIQKMEQEKVQELETLKENLESDKTSALGEQKEELTQKFEAEKRELKEKHDKELRQMQTSHENKMKQQLAQLESNLKEEFRKEIDEKNEETERAIRELQESERQAVKEAKEQTKKEVTERYEKKIEELETSLDEMKRQLTERAEEEKEIALKTQREQLERQYDRELEDQERDLREELSQKYELMLEEKDKEIKELKKKLATSDDGSNN